MADKDSVGTTLWEKVGKFVDNVATLDVVTLTGNIELQINQADAAVPLAGGQQPAAGGPLAANDQANNNEETSWKQILTSAKAAAPQSAFPVAISHYEFDQDAVLYVKSDAPKNYPEMLALHNKTVETAQQVRSDFVKSLMNVFD